MADLGEKFVIKHTNGTIEKAHVYSTRDECNSDDVMKIGDGYVPLKKYAVTDFMDSFTTDFRNYKVIAGLVQNKKRYPDSILAVMKQAVEIRVPFFIQRYLTVSSFTEFNDTTKGATNTSSYLGSKSLSSSDIGTGGYCELGYQHITFPANVTHVMLGYSGNSNMLSIDKSRIVGKSSLSTDKHYVVYKVTPN